MWCVVVCRRNESWCPGLPIPTGDDAKEILTPLLADSPNPVRRYIQKATPFWSRFLNATEKRSFYQDRLGTNIGKALKKGVALCRQRLWRS